MQAVIIKEFGSVDGLELRDTSDPGTPRSGELLVRVRAAGLNRADLLQARGMYPPPPGYPADIPGLEFAGEVLAVGDGDLNIEPGARVFGITAGGAQAEMLVVDSGFTAPMPEHLSFTEAACVPEAFVTAHDALATQARLTHGETLLIHAAGSGVGLAAMQIGKALGVRIIGTSRSADKIERCLAAGLDDGIVVDAGAAFSEEVLALTDGRGVDCVLDLVGGPYLEESLKCLAVKGRIMLVGLTGGRRADLDLGLILGKRARIIGTVLRPRSAAEKSEAVRSFAEEVLPHFGSKELRPNLDRVFPATEAVAAYKYLGSNESFGKVVIEF